MERGLLLHFSVLSLFLSFMAIIAPGVQSLGVNYGMLGNNLPSPPEVIAHCKSRNIHNLRLFSPDHNVLDVLRDTGISVILTAFKEELLQLARDPASASGWVQANIVPYAGSVNFRYITMGNEEIPGDSASLILPAMNNVAGALRAAGLNIPVTTAVSMAVVGSIFPPSQGTFTDQAIEVMRPIIAFLESTGAPLLVNVYPYFSYIGDPGVKLEYALFARDGVEVQDGNHGYWNLFDAMVDTVKSAMERVGHGGVNLVVSETGWPSDGNPNIATIENAKTYNNNLVKHVKSKAGTPKSPGKEMEVYVFAMFNEDLKPEGTERNFGLFYPDMKEVYHVDF